MRRGDPREPLAACTQAHWGKLSHPPPLTEFWQLGVRFEHVVNAASVSTSSIVTMAKTGARTVSEAAFWALRRHHRFLRCPRATETAPVWTGSREPKARPAGMTKQRHVARGSHRKSPLPWGRVGGGGLERGLRLVAYGLWKHRNTSFRTLIIFPAHILNPTHHFLPPTTYPLRLLPDFVNNVL